ncbi:MAG: GNAT family N-acetyltransferase [Actinocrinis sp.]
MQIVSFPEADTPPELRAQALALQAEAWPSLGAPEREPGHDPLLHPLSMLLVEDGRVLATLDILSKEIVHAGRRLTAGGLSTVVTCEGLRGKGLGRQLVTAARELMAGHTSAFRRLDVGLFTCDRPLLGFYERAGWQLLPGTVLVGGTPAEPFPSDQPGFDKVTLGGFFTRAGREARASFPHARVALYPGEIDKLW